MIDLHTHSLFSDGSLLPSELVRRAAVKGCRAIAITDHVDASNIDFVLERISRFCAQINEKVKIKVIPGVEITHVLPEDFSALVSFVRSKNKYALIVAHGQTLVEPVAEGTNLAAIKAGVDILAHPGLLTLDEAYLAAEKGVFLEISARKGHCLGNGNVAKVALQARARLVINTDTHAPDDLISREQAEKICRGSGLDADEFKKIRENSEFLAGKFGSRSVNP